MPQVNEFSWFNLSILFIILIFLNILIFSFWIIGPSQPLEGHVNSSMFRYFF